MAVSSVLSTACSHEISHIKPAALTDTVTDTTPKVTEFYTPERRAILQQVKRRGQDCRAAFERCTKPAPACKQDMNVCEYRTVVDLKI
jgi:hypothetical protein